ncbi:hypothetical protein FEM48_Zijuj09G0231700 [Ziziphus jujuba var. spinosa]|uniref:Retrovirus-related Pol polyprotein from transposon TNT 1-94-like beta-barrel domain-containing protein n=1 Tax=Ziziphus jujuba var. spinosa TaxID=714518 RepID=A0A978UVV6_ZIZJJ|nr:hypothetical protein FEM48_Zijuj09G0231700 [Ziziphus jujuba var. spinosa]
MPANLTSYIVPSALSNDHNPTANVVSASLQKDPSWFLDSGATNHIVADGDSLLEQIEYQGNNKLVVGNDRNLEITHLGNTLIPSLSMIIKLNNVLVVPRIAKNLLSISQLTRDNELTAEFTAQCCFIKDKVGQIQLKGVLQEGLYKLHVPAVQRRLLTANNVFATCNKCHKCRNNCCCGISETSYNHSLITIASVNTQFANLESSNVSDLLCQQISESEFSLFHRRLGHPNTK